MSKERSISRQTFLSNLQAILPGMSPKGIIQQSKCVVFYEGQMVTFNGELCCRTKSGLGTSFKGAVDIKPLVDALGLLDTDKITVSHNETEMLIDADGVDRNYIVMEQEVLLPVDKVDDPEEWQRVPKSLADGISMVEGCASSDQNVFSRTCIQFHKKWVEAYDNKHMARFMVKTGLDTPILVRRDAIKYIVGIDMTEMSVTKGWIHFRNPAGVMYSCRYYGAEKFNNLDEMIDMKGETLVFPKTLDQVIKRAENWSKEVEDNNHIQVELKPNLVRLKGVGTNGRYIGKRSMKYKGKGRVFYVPPKILFEVIKKQTECEICEERLKIESPRFVYVTMLSLVKPAGKGKKEEE